jgi:hypothetical protein
MSEHRSRPSFLAGPGHHRPWRHQKLVRSLPLCPMILLKPLLSCIADGQCVRREFAMLELAIRRCERAAAMLLRCWSFHASTAVRTTLGGV